uniref:Zgc:114041 n=1 Tax=Poecilia reticulata TaxID=8081 RepID=A0A3P9NRZ2_POERE
MKSRRVGPPDGGYGWVVVASAFFAMGLTGAVLKNFGLFFLEIQSHFGVLTSTTSWVSSTTIAMFHIGAPAASALTLRFSQRVVIVVGGVLCTLGMSLASLDINLPWLYLTMGVLEGTGISFSWVPAISMVNHYFSRWRPIAYAIASSGECVLAIVFSPLLKWLIEKYSWQGALLIIGGLQFNLCVCGALMRPLEATRASQTNLKESAEDSAAALPPKKKAVFRLGIDKYWPAFILSVMAVADLVGRLFCGWLANMRLLRNLQLLTMVTMLQGVVLLLLPISHDYWSVLVFALLYGFLFGCMVAIHVTSIVDIVSLEGFDSGLGLFMLFRSIGGFIGPPAGGWLVDQTNNFGAAFYLSGVCLVTSAVFVVLVDRLVQRRKSVEAAGHQTIHYEGDGDTGKIEGLIVAQES